ncbi:aldehyde oxidase [Candidatus Atribacteria bacterium RBG_19FT_COMBO_35_14]|uniref:Aldehyde oxidase n=1 Tax=Candidatus Sediminicultor quintus TaxID=1797291 RepID=A0A1F5A8D3_9BACT|nr:MAG: aldehyde oxidase [Candidatus Atribacteria bacterium RBG_19FT_COMBO_35_14]
MLKSYVGKNVCKVDAQDKVTGQALYPDDIYFEDMLYLKIKRATHPHAYLRRIDTGKAEKLTGVVKIITAADIPQVKNFGLIIKDQPVLVGVGQKMRYMGDALAIVIAESKEVASQAVKLIEVEVEELEVISDPLRAMEKDAPLIHQDSNVLATHYLKKGDIKKGFTQADIIAENEYRTSTLDHVPLQVEAGVGIYDKKSGVIKLWVATQWLHDTQADIAQSLGLSKEKIRIIQPVIGGAFGKKEDISVHLHLALAAMETKRPVKLTYSREESMIAQSKRHPFIIRMKTGVTNKGYLTACQVEVIGDTGAYASSGPAVVHKGMYHCTGPYNVDNVSGVAYTVYTNNTYCGAMRGFGTTQMAFAYESQMDILAHQLGINPVQFRLQNAYDIGSSTPNSQRLTHSVGVKETIKGAAVMAAWKEGSP